MNKKIVAIGSVIGICFFGFFGYTKVMNENSQGSSKNKGTSVTYVVAEETSLEETFKSKGLVTTKKSNIIYSDNEGKVLDFLVDTGDVVTKGDILFSYDLDYLKDLEESLSDAIISLNIARTNLEGQKNNYTEAKEVNEIDLLPFETQVYNAELSITEYENSINRLEEEINTANQNLEKEKVEYEKRDILFENGLISKVDLENYKEVLESKEKILNDLIKQKEDLQSKLDSANYNLDVANQNLDYAKDPNTQLLNQAENAMSIGELNLKQNELLVERIQEKINNYKENQKSDYSGIVTAMYIDRGTSIPKGTKIMEITDNSIDNVVVVLDVSQKNISKVEEGQKVIITSSGIGNKEIEGKVTKVMSTADTISTNTGKDSITKVEVSLVDDIEGLKKGFVVDAEVTVAEYDDAVTVPILSVSIDDEGNSYLFIVNDNDEVEKRFVEHGVILGSKIQVTGVEVDERIITNNLKNLEDGDKVNPTEEV